MQHTTIYAAQYRAAQYSTITNYIADYDTLPYSTEQRSIAQLCMLKIVREQFEHLKVHGRQQGAKSNQQTVEVGSGPSDIVKWSQDPRNVQNKL